MRPRSRAIVFAVIVTVFCAGSTSAQDKKPTTVPPAIERAFEDAVAAYANGDDDAVARWFTSSTGRAMFRYADAVIGKPVPWSRARAAFVLEVAHRRGIGDTSLFAMGRTMVMGRPSALGVDPVEDRFEVLFHQIAVGILEGHPQVSVLADYVNAVNQRFDEARRRGVALESRLPLARAFTTALACCYEVGPGEIVRTIPGSIRNGMTLDVAVAQFEQAAREPALRAEALIRGAKLLFDSERKADALAWIERVPPHSDQALGYVHHWTHARILDTTERHADAAAAYRNALTFLPQSQPASIGVAAALLRAGQPDESAKAAADARAMQVPQSPAEQRATSSTSVMATFKRGDARLVQAWFAEIRRLRR